MIIVMIKNIKKTNLVEIKMKEISMTVLNIT